MTFRERIAKYMRMFLAFVGLIAALIFGASVTPTYQLCTQLLQKNDQKHTSDDEEKTSFLRFPVISCIDDVVTSNGNEITIISTFTVAFFTFTLWYSTEGLRGLGNRQADAVDKSLEIAARQEELSRQLFLIEHRPNIIARNFHIIDEFVHQDSIDVGFIGLNIGSSTAHITSVEAEVFTSRYSKFIPRNRTLIPILQEKFSLKSGAVKVFRIKSDAILGAGERDDIMSAKLRVYCVGCVLYTDDMGALRRTGFARIYDPVSGRFTLADDPEYEYSY